MNTLDKIIAFKKEEIAKIKKQVPLKKLVASPYFKRKPHCLKKALLGSENGIIAEFKRKSPSKGIINNTCDITTVTQEYIAANVAAQSILTDTYFFGGSVGDVIKARMVQNEIPILRKDFIVDGFQIVEAKAIGADVILLIATCLREKELKNYTQLAEDLGLGILYEIHTREDLDKIPNPDDTIIGINNRNLKTFEVDLENSLQLSEQIPKSCTKVAESGISSPLVIKQLQKFGFKGFLIGEYFMKTKAPGATCKSLITTNQTLSLEILSKLFRKVGYNQICPCSFHGEQTFFYSRCFIYPALCPPRLLSWRIPRLHYSRRWVCGGYFSNLV